MTCLDLWLHRRGVINYLGEQVVKVSLIEAQTPMY